MSPLFTPRREGEEFHEDQILSKAVKAGRRTYFFDVRATRGDDYFLTITESRKTVDAEGKTTYDRHKIFLYKEDFDKFVHGLSETLDYIRSHRPMPEPELQEWPLPGAARCLSGMGHGRMCPNRMSGRQIGDVGKTRGPGARKSYRIREGGFRFFCLLRPPAAGVFPCRSARWFRLLSGHLFRGVRIGPDDLLPGPRAAPETISFFG